MADSTSVEIEKRILQSQSDFKDIIISERILEDGVIQAGNNYVNSGSRFTLLYEKNGKKCEKSFHLKVPYKREHYEFLKRCKFYAKEIYMYETVFPLAKSLLPDDSMQPEFYGTDGKDGLILEDLSQAGYRVMRRLEQLDFEHCRAAFKLLAKFHGVSVKIQESQPHLLDPVREDTILSSTISTYKQYCSEYTSAFQTIVNRADPSYAEQHQQVLKFFQNNFLSMTVAEMKPRENAFNVLNHGSFWTNNVIFGYDSYGQVKNAKCIDVQTCQWGSPAHDILYFTITSMRFDIFEKYFHLLLETYLTNLNATLSYLRCKNTLNMDNLRADIESKCGFRMYLVASILPYVLAQPNKDVKKIVVDEEPFVQVSNLWIRHFIKSGIFSKYEDAAIAMSTFVGQFEAENRVNISKCELEENVVKPGLNFTTGIRRFAFEYKNGEKTVRDSIFLKIPSLCVNYKTLNEADASFYAREIYMYERILPQMYKFWKGGEPFSPRYYASTPARVVILEDLSTQGFCLPDKRAQLDLHHSLVAIKTLAHYHALGVKYLQKFDKCLDEFLTAPMPVVSAMEPMWNSMYESFLQNVEALVSKSIFAKLKEFEGGITKVMQDERFSDENSLKVIAHGDCSIINILFKYDENGRANAARLVDYQLSRKSSPAIDLIEFFVTAIRFDVFKKYNRDLLNTYVNTLNKTLAVLDVNYVYSSVELEQTLKKCSPIFIIYILALSFIFSKNDSSMEMNHSELFSTDTVLAMVKWLNHLEKTNII